MFLGNFAAHALALLLASTVPGAIAHPLEARNDNNVEAYSHAVTGRSRTTHSEHDVPAPAARALAKREDKADQGTMWAADGPSYKDIKQGAWDSNWFVASLVAFMKLGKAYEETFYDSGSVNAADRTTKQMTISLKEKDGEWDITPTKVIDIIKGADAANDYVWVQLLETHVIKLGGYDGLGSGNKIEKGKVEDALHMLTGQEADTLDYLHGDKLWDELVKSSFTPMVVELDARYTTWNYAVMETKGDGDEREVRLADANVEPFWEKLTSLDDKIMKVFKLKDDVSAPFPP